MRPRLRASVVALAISLIAAGASALAQVHVPPESLYVPKPSQDLRWAVGDWLAQGAHPAHGDVPEWRITTGANGTFRAELPKSPDQPALFERGIWVAVDRDLWSFTTLERDRRALPSPVVDLYTILAIAPDAIELRHMQTGQVLRLVRGSAG